MAGEELQKLPGLKQDADHHDGDHKENVTETLIRQVDTMI